MTLPTESDVDPRLLAALGHPTRQQLAMALSDAPSSANELAERLGLTLAVVRRHLRVLLDNDAIEVASDALATDDDRRYRLMVRPFLVDAPWGGSARGRCASSGTKRVP